jgi:DNA-binding PadR family transcriptional regulator
MQLGERGLELLKVMADGKLYALNALATSTRQHHEVAGRLLGWLAELGLVEKLELHRVDWKRGELGSVKVYRITPEGLKAISAPQPPAPPSGAAPESVRGRGGAVGRAEGRRRAWNLQLLRIMADGELWGVYALCFALARTVGGSATSGGRYRLVKRHLKRLLERGEVEALELHTAAREGGFATVPVYRITLQGLAALERGAGVPAPQPEQRSEQRKRPGQRDPAELLKIMEDDSLWTLNALAKATGWEKKVVKEHLRRLAEHVEAVEVRKASRKSKTVKTAYVYRLKRAAGPQALSGRRVEPQALGRSGTCNNVVVNPSFDILAALSDGALWTAAALKFATRRAGAVIGWHLRRLAELGLVETVEVREARRRGPSLSVARLYRITEKGLEALERGLPPLPEVAPPRAEPEPPEGGDPMQLALWVVEWSAYAARALLHLRSRSGEDTYSNVAVAAGGYRSMPSKSDFNAILFRLRELNLIEWEHRRALGGRPRRIVKLTDKGQEVASAILKLAALLRETGAESF